MTLLEKVTLMTPDPETQAHNQFATRCSPARSVTLQEETAIGADHLWEASHGGKVALHSRLLRRRVNKEYGSQIN